MRNQIERQCVTRVAVLLGILLISGCGADGPNRLNDLADIRRTLIMEASVEPGEKGDTSIDLKFRNGSQLALALGADILVCAAGLYGGGSEYEAGILARSTPDSWRAGRQLMFSMGADRLLGYTDNTKTHLIFGCSGQGINVVNGSSCGNWPENLGVGEATEIQSNLMTREPTAKGWVAGLIVTTPSGAQGRILREFGTTEPRSIFVDFTPRALSDIMNDSSLPHVVRRWAAVWLASLRLDHGRSMLAEILTNPETPIEVRRGAAAGLAIYDTPKAMAYVSDAMWQTTTPKELRLFCFWSLTWSDHPEAKPLISKAVDHPDPDINNDARERQK
jgi:hypothetical protein